MTRATFNAALAGATLFAAAAAFAGPVAAQPRLEQTGDGYSVVYDGAERGNVAGGRAASLAGGGEDAHVLYSGPDTAPEGRFAVLSGGGDNATVSYLEPAAAAPVRGVADKAPVGAATGKRG
jgi:hypothetical protein